MGRVCVAISGGVDSAVAVHLLLKQGHAVETVHMRTWQSEDGAGECPWREDLESARSVAEFLGVPFRVVSMMSHYRNCVVDPLIGGYAGGITPNPDMLCNRHIKFGRLLENVLESGCDFLATGHYCRLKRRCGGECSLHSGLDGTKDQSYFLAAVRREVLPSLLFPIGNLTKVQVRAIARTVGLPNAGRRDSQDICFLGGKISIRDFLGRHLAASPGDIVTRDGRLLGQHRGLFRYTIGQRRGIGVPSNRDFENYVVIDRDVHHNRLVVAFESDAGNDLWTSEANLHSVNFLCAPLSGCRKLSAKTRYRDASVPVTVTFGHSGTAHVAFVRPERALAAGQTLAFYRGSRLLGGGIYESMPREPQWREPQ